jgi:hypothetical protein
METTLADALTASDRCDRCGAAAMAHAELSDGGELLFCMHHIHEHRDRLEASGARVSVKELVA